MHRGTPYQLNVISDFSPMHQACNFHCINIILKAFVITRIILLAQVKFKRCDYILFTK